MIYRLLIDPLLSGIRNEIKQQIEPGSSCLDIACGTGDMVFRLMDHCSSVTGIDMDESRIRAAQKRVDIKGLDHLSFQVKDATKLDEYVDNQFDYALISLAIHQFSPDLRDGIVLEASRVSKTLIIADYSTPMPKTFAGKVAEFIEFLAGKEHNSNFKHFQRNGGLKAQMQRLGLSFNDTEYNAPSVFTITKTNDQSKD